MKEEKKISLDDKIINWVSFNLFYSFLILILIIVLVLVSVFGITALIYEDKTILNPNEIGDVIGGMTAPIIGLFSAFLVYIAFRAQINANEELQEFNKKQVGFNELSEILILEKNLEEDFENLHFTFFDKFISQQQHTYKGRDAINQLNDFLLNYKTHQEDFITSAFKANTILEPYFIAFISKTIIFYTNVFFILESFDESNIKPAIKKFIFNKIQLKYRINLVDLDFLVENYKNEKHPIVEEKILSLFNRIKETNKKFNSIKRNFQ